MYHWCRYSRVEHEFYFEIHRRRKPAIWGVSAIGILATSNGPGWQEILESGQALDESHWIAGYFVVICPQPRLGVDPSVEDRARNGKE